ncbi:MAG: LamG domain-containing protein, partial [Planctomycetia bacterium]|nr:LamG domain-containing protein [Planctomycetia bacterium]
MGTRNGFRWQSRPPLGSGVDNSSPLARGLLADWLFNEGGGPTLYSPVGAATLTLNGTSAACHWATGGVGEDGPAVVTDGASGYLSGPLSGTALTGLTVGFRVNVLAGSVGAGLFQWASVLNDGSPFLLAQVQAGPVVSFYLNNGYVSPTIPIQYGVPVDLAATWQSATGGGNWNWYANGVPVGSLAVGGANQANAQKVYLGNGYNGYSNARFSRLRVYSRALPASDVLALSTDRYAAVLAPPSRRFFAATGPTRAQAPVSAGFASS